MRVLVQSQQLFSLIEKRLALMQAIAFYKYQHHLPIYFPQVEKNNLLDALTQIKNLHLPISATTDFIQLLIQLSRELQENWLRVWQDQPETDLMIKDIASLRQDVKTATINILSQIVEAQLELSDPSYTALLENLIQQTVTLSFVSAEEKHNLLNHLIAIAKTKRKTDV